MSIQRTNGNATLSTFVGGSLVREELVYCAGTPPNRSAYYPHIATFCPECGELWRREVYTYHFDYAPIPWARWRTQEDLCPSCTPAIFTQLLRNYP